jgi:hypothetical protein
MGAMFTICKHAQNGLVSHWWTSGKVKGRPAVDVVAKWPPCVNFPDAGHVFRASKPPTKAHSCALHYPLIHTRYIGVIGVEGQLPLYCTTKTIQVKWAPGVMGKVPGRMADK